ncbi:hypothetical protein [Xenorhabdus entomophaga]|uniref:hypothetical protein n=1 Tax=Xenorhabdus entomophaga TaxID=3136257 RepID=UPI0030F46E33
MSMLTVYPSFGHSNENYIIKQSNPYDCTLPNVANEIINCRVVSNYSNNTYYEALFVEITGTDDPNDKTKPLIGSDVTLSLKIDSSNKKLEQVFYRKIPTDGTSLIIGIPITSVSGFNSFANVCPGRIIFSYEAIHENRNFTSHPWLGKIDTMPPIITECLS